MELFFIYLGAVSLLAIILTNIDKQNARRGRRRISEFTLMVVAAVGGSAAMYLTMQVIRHKTRKKKFMVGIPVILLIQVVVFAVMWRMSVNG